MSLLINRKYLKIPFLIFIGISLFFIFLPTTNSHGDGQFIQIKSGEHTIDIDYNVVNNITSQSPVRFDFSLLDPFNDPVPFTDIWIRISEDQKTFFAAGIQKAKLGRTGMLYTFSKPGQFELYLRFQDNSLSIVEASTSLEILASNINKTGSETTQIQPLIMSSIAGALLAFAICIIMFLYKKNN